MALAGAMSDRWRGRRRQRVLLLAAAAGVVLVAGLAAANRHLNPSVTLVAMRVGSGSRLFHDGASTRLDEGYAVTAGDRVVAGHGEGIAVRLSTGTTLKVEAAGELQVVDDGPTQRFTLLRGTVRADVAKLRSRERFVVATLDAEIEVRGTSFQLSVAVADTVCDEPSATRLEVFEGVVAVRRGNTVTLVGAGEVWPTGCRSRPAVTADAASVTRSAPIAVAIEAPPPVRPRVAARPARVAAEPPQEEPNSTLSAQNNLYARAMSAGRRGDYHGALEAFFELERRFPSSPLSESSMVGRMRLVAARDRAAGRAVAREYLDRYPAGFARAEAGALAAEPPAR
jgi:hypothetical protein